MADKFGTPAYKLFRKEACDTAKEAARSVDTTKMEKYVLDIVRSFGEAGCISEQVVAIANGHYGVTGRFSALVEKGYIVDTGERRVNSKGRKQRVLKAIK